MKSVRIAVAGQYGHRHLNLEDAVTRLPMKYAVTVSDGTGAWPLLPLLITSERHLISSAL